MHFFWAAVQHIVHPVDLLNESTFLNTVLLIRRGVNIYSPETFDGPPFHLTLYTPLYFALVSIVHAWSDNPFLMGRMVSLIFLMASLAAMSLTFGPQKRWWLGAVAAGWILLLPPFRVYAPYFRMDTTALFFSIASVSLLYANSTSSRNTCLAAALAAMSVLSKQSFFCSGAACILYLFCVDRRRGLLFAAVFFSIVGLAFYGLQTQSGGGFLWCVAKAPRNPISSAWFLETWDTVTTPSLILLILLSGIACRWAVRHAAGSSSDPPAKPILLLAIYYLAGWIWLMASVGKLGAHLNYFIEPLFASVWLLAACVDRMDGDGCRRRPIRMAMAFLPLFFAWDAVYSRSNEFCSLVKAHPPAGYQRVKSEIEALGVSSNPKVLGLAIDRLALSVGWDLYVNDVYLYRLLWNTGVLSNRSILRSLDQRYFDVILLEKGTRPETISNPTPIGQIYMKIFERYEFKSEATFACYLPRHPAS